MLSILLLVACKSPVEAPEELGELSIYLFENFDGEEGAELAAGVPGLEAWLGGLDLAGNLNDRTVSPPILTPERWGGVPGATEADPEAQVPITVGGESRHAFSVHRELVGEENYVCIDSDSTKYARREFLTPIDCFLDGTCDRVDTTNEVRKETFLANVWYDFLKDHRVVTLDDGREVMFARGWTDQVWQGDSGGSSWDQVFVIDAWIPDGERTLRFYTVWSSVTIPGINDDAYAGLVKSGIDEGFQNADNFVDGEMCGNDRDRENDRP